MHDIKFIRENPEIFDEKLALRGISGESNTLIKLDEDRRSALAKLQELQTQRNENAKMIGQLKKNGEDAQVLMQNGEALKTDMASLQEDADKLDTKLTVRLGELPNLPADDCPHGKSEDDNSVVSTWGTPRTIANPQQHFDIGETLGMMDFARAVKLSGSRHVWLQDDLARLERAISNFMLDHHFEHFGYREVSPPYVVNEETMYGVGQLPKFRDDLFQTTNGQWLIPTAEVVLTYALAKEITKASDLPLRYTAYTPCFRLEAGAAGKDTRGMVRLHQFSKVELVTLCTPDQSVEEHERMTTAAESILQKLDLPYQRMLLCTGDMGFSSTKTYDLNVWLPGQNAYREISSCSNCGDFQARRMNARFKNAAGKNEFLHTLNGSGLAVGRTLVAVLENYLNEDGSVTIPDVLRPYMRGQEKIVKGS